MALFDQLCALGNQADNLLATQQFDRASSAYIDILTRSDEAGVLDSFILAKVTLGYLLSLVQRGDIAKAHQAWTFKPEEHLLGHGVLFLETAQTSVHDLMIYSLVSAHLHAHGTDAEAALEGVNTQMRRVARYALSEAPGLLPTVIGNWRKHLEEIFERPFQLVPLDAQKELQELEAKAGKLTVPVSIRVSFPQPSLWQIDWASEAAPISPEENMTPRNEVNDFIAAAADITQPSPTIELVEPPPMASNKTIEDRMDIVNALMENKNYPVALRKVSEVKADLLSNKECDPSLLGWVLFFEFKCLYKLERYDDALNQATEKLDVAYDMTPNNAAFRAAMCSELCVRAGRPVEQVVAFGTESFLRRTQGDPLHTLQTLNTSCRLLELRDAEDKAESFARNMIIFGSKSQADVPVIKGYISLMRGKLRAGKDTEIRPIVDELFGTIRPLPKSAKRAELMSEVARLETSRSPLPTNKTRLARFLQTSAS